MRHRHLIQKIGGCSYPSQLVFLDVDSESVTDPINPARLNETLTGWTGIGVSGVGGVYGKQKEASGMDATSLWQSLAMRLRRGGIVWCFSENAGRVWSLLNLWEMIEDGHCGLLGHDAREGGSVRQGSVRGVQGNGILCENGRGDSRACNLQRMREHAACNDTGAGKLSPKRGGRTSGVCILEDPPVVIDVRISGLSGRLRIVDLANYGLAVSGHGFTARCRVDRTARFVLGMIDTLRTENLGSLKTTAASQAVSSWKFAHLKYPVLCHDNPQAESLEEKCYYGGRCEASHIGTISERIYHLDVSSMYTSICAGASLPSCLSGFSDAPAGLDHDTLLRESAVLATVTLETDTADYPYHDIRSKLTIWPVGTFTTSLAGPELLDAFVRGRIKKWHKVAWYERSPFLCSFALHMLRLRERYSDNSDLCRWIKSLGVSVVGKLGQRSRYWEDKQWGTFCDPWAVWYSPNGKGGAERWRSVAGFTQIERISGFSYDAVPAAASWVTSLGRVMLLSLMRIAGYHHVQYCDTDSLMVSEPGYENLCSANVIGNGCAGMLRLVSVNENVEIRGIKDYIEGTKHVQAGKPHEALAEGWPTGQAWIHARLKGACYSRTRPSAVRIAIPYETKAVYRHGIVLPDGSVRPHILEEEC